MSRSIHPAGTARSPRLANQWGAGLIEVLILVVVLSVGMLAMAKIHTVLLRDGGTAANRALASSLAQEKMDDLRSYKWIDRIACLAGGDSSAACGVATTLAMQSCQTVFCYADIASSVAGTPNAGGGARDPANNSNLSLPSGTVTVGNIDFNRSWAVADNTQLKTVTVTIAWTDQNGPGKVELVSAIAPSDYNAVSVGAGGVTIPLQKPKASYTAQGVPDVVPITIDSGSGSKRETSKPLPEVSSKLNSVVTEFESVNYSQGARQTVESYATVGCVCEFAGTGQGLTPAYFTQKDGALTVAYPTATVSKVIGRTATISGEKQDPLCDSCCANHHDSSSSNIKYDPDRPSGDTDSGNHNHYYFTNPSRPQDGLTKVTSGLYLEACRFLRVDGIYRLMQDWRLVNLTVMPKNNYLIEGSTSPSALTTYQEYVARVVTTQANADRTGGAAEFPTRSTDRNLSNQPAGSSNQLVARGIYVDRVYDASGSGNLDAASYNPVSIEKIPFNEINVTLLASWSATPKVSPGPSVVSVTNDPIRTIESGSDYYAGTYSRGRTTVLSTTSVSDTAVVTAYMLPSTSGLVGGATRDNYASAVDYTTGSVAATPNIAYAGPIGIDRHDHASVLRRSDSLEITRASGNVRVISGTISQGNSSAALSSLQVSGTGASCSISDVTSGQATFSCVVNVGASSVITVSTAQPGGFVRTTSQGTPAGATTSSTCSADANTNSCPGFFAFGPLARLTGSCSASGGANCATGYTITGTNSAICVAGSTPYCDVPVTATTPSWTGTITVNGTLTCGNTNNPATCTTGIEVGPGTAQSNTISAKCSGNSLSGPSKEVTATAGNQSGAFNMCVN